MAKVTIAFDAYGQMSADATGFAGTACEEATRNILAGLGSPSAETKKPEYYDMDVVSQSDGLRQTL